MPAWVETSENRVSGLQDGKSCAGKCQLRTYDPSPAHAQALLVPSLSAGPGVLPQRLRPLADRAGRPAGQEHRAAAAGAGPGAVTGARVHGQDPAKKGARAASAASSLVAPTRAEGEHGYAGSSCQKIAPAVCLPISYDYVELVLRPAVSPWHATAGYERGCHHLEVL